MLTENRKKIEAALKSVKELPTLPVVYSQLQNVLADPRVSAREVSAVIEHDQALSSKLLRIVNCAYYGFPRKISTLSQAVVILGFNEIKHLTLSVSIMKMFDSGNKDVSFDHIEFWRHSLSVAICSGIIAKKSPVLKCISHEEAFVAGLLHDIGIIFEDQYLHDFFKTTIQNQKAKDLFLYDAEKSTIGFTHEQIGELLVESWNLPQSLSASIGFHHSPLAKKRDGNLFPLVSTVHVADICVRACGIGSAGDFYVTHFYDDCWKQLSIPMNEVDGIIKQTIKVYLEMSSFLFENNSKKEK